MCFTPFSPSQFKIIRSTFTFAFQLTVEMQKILCILICHLLEMPGNLLTIQVLSHWTTSQFTVYLFLTFCLEKDWQLHTYTRLCYFSFLLAFQTEFKFLHPINLKNNSYTSLFTPIYACNILHNLFRIQQSTVLCHSFIKSTNRTNEVLKRKQPIVKVRVKTGATSVTQRDELMHQIEAQSIRFHLYSWSFKQKLLFSVADSTNLRKTTSQRLNCDCVFIVCKHKVYILINNVREL